MTHCYIGIKAVLAVYAGSEPKGVPVAQRGDEALENGRRRNEHARAQRSRKAERLEETRYMIDEPVGDGEEHGMQ